MKEIYCCWNCRFPTNKEGKCLKLDPDAASEYLKRYETSTVIEVPAECCKATAGGS